MPMTLSELARTIGAELRGNGDHLVEACRGLTEADARSVSFLSNSKYISKLRKSDAGAVILGPEHADRLEGRNVLVAADPYFAFRNAVVALHGWRQHPAPVGSTVDGVSDLAAVHTSAQLGEGVTVHPFACVSERARIGARTILYPGVFVGPDAEIGEDCQLFPNVVVYDRCTLGNRVTLHAGCVIGQDGFGYATHPNDKGEVVHHKIPQAGSVHIEDDVELGAGCAIDRGTVTVTRIGRGTKFSNLVTLGHGVEVGKHNLFVAQVGIAGSSTTGDYVAMGGQAGVVGHIRVGHQAQVAAKAGVLTNVPDKARIGGFVAIDMDDAHKVGYEVIRLPQLVEEFHALQKRVAELEQNRSSSKA